MFGFFWAETQLFAPARRVGSGGSPSQFSKGSSLLIPTPHTPTADKGRSQEARR
jgi:hypothetical protein